MKRFFQTIGKALLLVFVLITFILVELVRIVSAGIVLVTKYTSKRLLNVINATKLVSIDV